MNRPAQAAARRSTRVRVTPADQRAKLLAWCKRNGAIGSTQARAILGSSPRAALTRLAELVASGDLGVVGAAHHKSWFAKKERT